MTKAGVNATGTPCGSASSIFTSKSSGRNHLERIKVPAQPRHPPSQPGLPAVSHSVPGAPPLLRSLSLSFGSPPLTFPASPWIRVPGASPQGGASAEMSPSLSQAFPNTRSVPSPAHVSSPGEFHPGEEAGIRLPAALLFPTLTRVMRQHGLLETSGVKTTSHGFCLTRKRERTSHGEMDAETQLPLQRGRLAAQRGGTEGVGSPFSSY